MLRSVWRRTRLRRHVRAIRFDVMNLVRHGQHAPRYAQSILIDPQRVQLRGADDPPWPPRSLAGTVVGGDWDLHTIPLREHPKVRACYLHWQGGVPWEETGAFEHMLEMIERLGGECDGCRNIADIRARYERLDAMFEQVRSQRRLLSGSEIDPSGFRGNREPMHVNVGRSGDLIAGVGGLHRLAAAQILALPAAPALVGVVHIEAVRTWRGALIPR